MKRIIPVLVGFVCIFLLGVSYSSGAVLDVPVGSHAMPWVWNTSTLNPTFQFGVQDGINPLIVSSSDGFSFASGDTFTISYLSGLTSAFGGTPVVDANGYVDQPFNNFPGSSGKYAPSLYMSPATYPINLNELVGTFADSFGTIIGTPFAIGNGPASFIVPVGATQLQMGVNDDIFGDNTGSLMVQVSGPSSLPSAVPEPTTMLLLGSGMVGMVPFIRRKLKK
jgi:hypothetical protein